MNNQEKTIIAPLGQALQDARLVASLSLEEVADKLHLSVTTVRDIEDNLDNCIENKTYPAIYLRGYLANYAKLVALNELDRFIEYQDLLPTPKTPDNLRSPIIIPPTAKKRSKLFWLFFVIVIVAAIYLLVTQVDFFSDSQRNHQQISTALDVQAAPEIVATRKIENEVINVQLTENTAVSEPQKQESNPVIITAQVIEEASQEEIVAKILPPEVTPPEAAVQPAVVTESLQLTFSADCWTEIFDATGKRLAFDLYKKGALLTVSGVAPFQLKLGDPSGVAIQYQDKLYARDFAEGRTARFSVPQ